MSSVRSLKILPHLWNLFLIAWTRFKKATEDESEGLENILNMTEGITHKTKHVNEIIQTNIELIKELDALVNQFKI